MQRRCKYAFPIIQRIYFLRSPRKMVIKKSSDAGSSSIEWSPVSERQPARTWAWELSKWQLQNNGKKAIRPWKEDFECDLKWQWDCYKSVTWVWLVKTENPSACVTVICNMCRPATVLYYLQFRVPRRNPIVQSRPRLINHATPLYVTIQQHRTCQVLCHIKTT
jgi:hypothetical protein